MSSPLARATFSIAAHKPSQWLPDDGREVAFAGRSNVGKSTAINAITGRRSLARISKTPGRTRQIVFFAVDQTRHLVDLPGYGYAKAPANLRRHWEQVIEHYFHTRRSLCGLILPMDARHPLTALDEQMLHWCEDAGLPVHILLTKSDKLSRAKASAALQQVRKRLSHYDCQVSVQLFSAPSQTGIEEARSVITGWLGLDSLPKKTPE